MKTVIDFMFVVFLLIYSGFSIHKSLMCEDPVIQKWKICFIKGDFTKLEARLHCNDDSWSVLPNNELYAALLFAGCTIDLWAHMWKNECIINHFLQELQVLERMAAVLAAADDPAPSRIESPLSLETPWWMWPTASSTSTKKSASMNLKEMIDW